MGERLVRVSNELQSLKVGSVYQRESRSGTRYEIGD